MQAKISETLQNMSRQGLEKPIDEKTNENITKKGSNNSTKKPLNQKFHLKTIFKTIYFSTIAGSQQCRSHTRNKDQTYMKKSLMDYCEVFEFSDENPDNYNKPRLFDLAPLCGFNKNSNAICPLFPGDDYFQDLLGKYNGVVSKLNCHRLSGVIVF